MSGRVSLVESGVVAVNRLVVGCCRDPAFVRRIARRIIRRQFAHLPRQFELHAEVVHVAQLRQARQLVEAL